MGFGDQKYDITVKDIRTGEPITSGVYAFVYTADSKTLATIYSNDARTSKTNPITRTQFAADDLITFKCAATSVDIYINDDKGNSAFVAGVTPTDHVIFLDRTGTDKCIVVPYSFHDNTETDTGIDIPLHAYVYDVIVEVVTIDATETINVGLLSSETSGDADGFVVAAPISTAGMVRLWTITDTTTEDYVTAPYKGALFGKGSAGTSAANDFGQSGGPGHVILPTKAQSLTYTTSAGSDAGLGYIHVFFKQMR